jgi:hypothetical protein
MLPQYIIDIIQVCTTVNHIDDAMPMLQKYGIKKQAAQALRFVAARVAERHEKKIKGN